MRVIAINLNHGTCVVPSSALQYAEVLINREVYMGR